MSPVRLVPEQGDGPEKAGKAGPERETDGPPDDNDEEDEVSRRRTNIMIGTAVAVVIAIGVWLVDALLEQRRIDECMAQGRRNCGKVEIPAR